MRRVLNFLVNLGDEHPRRPISVGFLLDLSGSMAGEPREALREAVLQGIVNLAHRVGGSARDEATLVTFDEEVRDLCPWIPRDEFDFLTDCLSVVPDVVLKTGGSTRFYDALWHTLERCRLGSDHEHDCVLIVCSDGGECASREHSRDDVLAKLRECLQGDSDGVPRPLRVLSLHFGADDDGLMRELAEVSGGEYFRDKSVDGIARMLGDAVQHIAAAGENGVRGRLVRRLREGHPPDRDFARFVSVNSILSTAFNVEPRTLDSGIVYDVEHETGLSRPEIVARFRKATDLVADVRELLVTQAQGERFRNARVAAEPFITVSLRGGDVVGLALALDFVRAVERANESGTLFSKTQGAEVVFALLFDGWESYSAEQWHALYGLLLELSNARLESAVTGICLITGANESPPVANRERGFAHLDHRESESLLVEMLVAMARWQSLSQYLAQVSADGGACRRFVSLGALSLFLDRELTVQRVTGGAMARLLSDVFQDDAPWADAARAQVDATAFDAELDEDRLWSRLVASGAPEGTLLDRLDGSQVSSFAAFAPVVRVSVPEQAPGGPLKKPASYRYRDVDDHLATTPLDVEEFVAVSHSLDFFRARLERNFDNVLTTLSRQLETLTDSQLCLAIGAASPAQARSCLAHLAARLKARLERAGEAFDQVLSLKREEFAPEVVRFEVRPGVFVDKSVSEWEELREAALSALLRRPHPQGVWAKYLQMTTVLGTMVAFGVLAGAGWPLWGPVAALTAAMPVLAQVKLARRQRQIAELLGLYEATHRALVRREAIQLVGERIGLIWQQLLRKVGEVDELPGAPDVDPYAPEHVSERALLELFRVDAAGALPDWLRRVPETPDQSAFRLDLAREQLRLRAHSVEGPVESLESTLPLLADSAWKRQAIESEARLRPAVFPAVTCRFVPPNLAGLQQRTALKVHVQEIVRERRYRLLALDELDAEDVRSLKALYENAEWARTIDALWTVSSQREEPRQQPLFLLWRAIAHYRLWLHRLSHVVVGDDPASKQLNLYAVWRRLAGARRDFRGALEQVVRAAVERVVSDKLAVFDLVAADRYPFGDALFDYASGFSFPPVRLQSLGEEFPAVRSLYFISERNAGREVTARPFGQLPQSSWEAQIPRAADLELVDDHEVAFVQLLPVPAGQVEALAGAASRFFALDPERRRDYLLEEFHSLVDEANGRPVGDGVCAPFLPDEIARRGRGEARRGERRP